ncbi:hypothetical protein SPRG_13948 [Saprolegnia parasitica CBS 223.65]|uniref:Uncharacterized protein n=1 Tax=Saprolegnia parasitica (strain CBS 223.65) TaxID=695850 RepID=A0A067BVZ3_SAPPC|nr:hypothetical protein SPRG_13948 [Saprolegnia parasitica CBS 223.65]KDO21020.1 hypothetical protein SPRG_13948 [Saprolegnia parasitica CBS 223.65]|eukprot:XP_012208272.1 hypothetical protein SPRG_13948 [Saprolegnia parasitica CBS 223.65]
MQHLVAIVASQSPPASVVLTSTWCLRRRSSQASWSVARATDVLPRAHAASSCQGEICHWLRI